MSALARWLDQQPPSIEETVIALYDALRDYIQLLDDLRDEFEGIPPAQLRILAADLEKAKAFLCELDAWGLCPDLLGLIKARK